MSERFSFGKTPEEFVSMGQNEKREATLDAVECALEAYGIAGLGDGSWKKTVEEAIVFLKRELTNVEYSHTRSKKAKDWEKPYRVLLHCQIKIFP